MDHMYVDQGAVVHDLALGRMDEAHASHIGRQLVHLVKSTVIQNESGSAILFLAQVK